MTKESIDKFFNSLSETDLNEKWSKYDNHSKENGDLLTVDELLRSWKPMLYSYDDIFELKIPPQEIIKVNIEKSESFFRTFLLY